MKRKFLLALICMALLCSLPVPASAAGGYVASKESDVYHDPDCPYVDSILEANRVWYYSTFAAALDGKRGCDLCHPASGDYVRNESSSKGSGSSGNSDRVSSYVDYYNDGYDTGYDEGYADGQEFGIDEGYDSGYDDGYAMGKKDGQSSGYREGYAQAESEAKKRIDSAECYAAIITLVACLAVGVPIANIHTNKQLEREKAVHNEQIRALKQQQLNEQNTAILQRISPGSEKYVRLPDGVELDIHCIPIKGCKSDSRPYGDFTAYITRNGKKYHYKRGCCGAWDTIHVLDRPVDLTPCSNCVGRDGYEAIPEWYLRLTGKKIPQPEAKRQTSTPNGSHIGSAYIATADYRNERLYITFSNGSTYYYYGVPENICNEMLNSPTPGKYFHEHIEGVYPYMFVK